MKTAVSPQFLLKLLPSGLIGAAAVLLLLAGVAAGGRTFEKSAFSAAGNVRSGEKSAAPESSRACGQLRTAARPTGKINAPLSSSPRPPQSAELLPRLHLHFDTTDSPYRPRWRPDTAALQTVLRRAIPARAGPMSAA